MDPTRDERDSQSGASNEAQTQSGLRRSRRLKRSGAASEEAPSSTGSLPLAAAAASTATMPTATTASSTRPVPRHHSTWVSQNRQMERQRSYYSDYYSNRNRSAAHTNSDSQSNTSPSTATVPARRSRSGSLGSSESRPAATNGATSTTSTSEGNWDLTEIGEAEGVFSSSASSNSRRLRSSSPSNNSSPRRPTTITRPVEPRVTPARASEAIPPLQALQGPMIFPGLTDSASTLTEFFARITGIFPSRNEIIIPAIQPSNRARENTGSEPSEPSEPFERAERAERLETIDQALAMQNLDAIFALQEGSFFNGLSKTDINRYTVTYEYKASAPLKRKRIKTDDGEAAAPSTSTSSATPNDGCSICLDKLNPNVIVRRLPCLHIFHIKCIDKWLKQNKKCPICRIAININYDKLMSSLESGSSINECLSQQELSSRSFFRPTITLQVASNGALGALTRISFTSAPTSFTSPSSSNSDNNN